MVSGENVDQRLGAWKLLKRCGKNTFFCCCEWVSAKFQEGGRDGRSYCFQGISSFGQGGNFASGGNTGPVQNVFTP
jgi:hypothetical protein